MRRSLLPLLLIFVLAVLSMGMTPQPPAEDDDPFPVGACVHVPQVRGKPLCVLIDPTG